MFAVTFKSFLSLNNTFVEHVEPQVLAELESTRIAIGRLKKSQL